MFMVEQPIDFVIPLLRETHVKLDVMSDKQDGLSKRIAALAQGQVSIRAEMKTMRDDISEVRADSRSMRDALHEVAIAIDGHSARLYRTERHLGLHDHKH